METGHATNLSIADGLDSDGELRVATAGPASYLDREQIKELIAHLEKVLEAEE